MNSTNDTWGVYRRRFLSALTVGGIASVSGCSGTSSSKPKSQAPYDVYTSWYQPRKSREQEAIDHRQKGHDAYDAADYNRALPPFRHAMKIYQSLSKEAKEKRGDLEFDTTLHELFDDITVFYKYCTQAAASGFNAAMAQTQGESAKAGGHIEDHDDYYQLASMKQGDIENKLESLRQTQSTQD